MTATSKTDAPGTLRESPGRGRPWSAPVLTGAVTVLATVVVGVRTPYAPGSYGVCPSVLLFGVYCPACGGLRAVHDLANLDLAGAMAMNPLLVLGLPLLVAAWCLWLLRALGLWTVPVRIPGWTGWVTLASLLLYAVVRNLSAFSWLAPGG